jgi:hypothetical protein
MITSWVRPKQYLALCIKAAFSRYEARVASKHRRASYPNRLEIAICPRRCNRNTCCGDYSEDDGQVGPLSLAELRQALSKFPKRKQVFVWRDGFTDWKLATDVAEITARTSLPSRPAGLTPSVDGKPRVSRIWATENFPRS